MQAQGTTLQSSGLKVAQDTFSLWTNPTYVEYWGLFLLTHMSRTHGQVALQPADKTIQNAFLLSAELSHEVCGGRVRINECDDGGQGVCSNKAVQRDGRAGAHPGVDAQQWAAGPLSREVMALCGRCDDLAVHVRGRGRHGGARTRVVQRRRQCLLMNGERAQ